eukprot:TRINITY_DN40584_c0_g1_i1.p1 TRINITY_DN40584_c0_g1~~TRINITY_DN40584_c0_g1_i1.p1  ORF type:complete len:363 (-),score=42.41 TRINITY_DN40584_c0_g1_i1:258-1292(-)
MADLIERDLIDSDFPSYQLAHDQAMSFDHVVNAQSEGPTPSSTRCHSAVLQPELAVCGVTMPSCDSAADVKAFSVQQVQEWPIECSAHFHLNGCCIVQGALPSQRCAVLSDFVDAYLHEAQCFVSKSGYNEALYQGELFGRVRSREHRWDLKLPLEGPVSAAMSDLCSSLGKLLLELVGPNAELSELSCIISDPGAGQQPLHTDFGTQRFAVLIALQPVTQAMGPTVLCPRTHSKDGSKLLSTLTGRKNKMLGATANQDQAIEVLHGKHMVCEVGDAVIYDTHLVHCGGANSTIQKGGSRRRVLAASFMKPGTSPKHSEATTIRKELRGCLYLRDFLPSHASDA